MEQLRPVQNPTESLAPPGRSSRALAFYNQTQGCRVADRVLRTRHIGQRLLGLMLRSSLDQGEGLWVVPCRAIHTVGMRFTIDAIFLDRSLVVVGLMERVKPFRVGKVYRKTHSVLEVQAGVIAWSRTSLGDQLRLDSGTPTSGF